MLIYILKAIYKHTQKNKKNVVIKALWTFNDIIKANKKVGTI